MRIDAHQHFWKIGKYDYIWMSPDMGVLYDDYGPEGVTPELQRHHIDKSILVQTISSLEETKWFLELAEENLFIAGVVGWVDLKNPAVGETLEEIRQDPKLVGIRHQVHDEPDVNWLLREDVKNGLRELGKRSVPYDLLIRPQHLQTSIDIAKAFPELPLVVDHIAKPTIAKQQWDDWAKGMKLLAECENVFCKLSGMITEADWNNWKPEDIKPYVEYLIEIFGTQRCMFGSDWPICLLAGTYSNVVEALEESTQNLSSSEHSDIWGSTVTRFYKLEIR